MVVRPEIGCKDEGGITYLERPSGPRTRIASPLRSTFHDGRISTESLQFEDARFDESRTIGD